MVDTSRAFVDAGASAVIDGKTHCPQGFEFDHDTPIIPSLSNFLFDWNRTDFGYNWWYGYMVRIGFSAGKAVQLQVIPTNYDQEAIKVRLLGRRRADKIFVLCSD